MPRINAVPGERRVLSPHYPRAHTSPALLQDTLHGAGQEPGPVTPLLSSEMARPPPRIRGEGPDGLVPSSSQPWASLNPETLGQRGGREWTLPPVGRAQEKPSDWVCSVLSPEGSPCGQGTGLQEVQGLAPQLHVTRSSLLAIRTPASRSAERVFPASHGQAVLGLTCPVTASGSPGPDGWCGYSPSGAQGWASASPGQQAAPGSLLTPPGSAPPVPTVPARTHCAGSSSPLCSPSSHSGCLPWTQGPRLRCGGTPRAQPHPRPPEQRPSAELTTPDSLGSSRHPPQFGSTVSLADSRVRNPGLLFISARPQQACVWDREVLGTRPLSRQVRVIDQVTHPRGRS